MNARRDSDFSISSQFGDGIKAPQKYEIPWGFSLEPILVINLRAITSGRDHWA
jgi:hypothetical protein